MILSLEKDEYATASRHSLVSYYPSTGYPPFIASYHLAIVSCPSHISLEVPSSVISVVVVFRHLFYPISTHTILFYVSPITSKQTTYVCPPSMPVFYYIMQ